MLETAAVRVTCVQMAPRVGEYEANQAAVIEAVASADADVVVLPELVTSGYVFESLEEARGGARPAVAAFLFPRGSPRRPPPDAWSRAALPSWTATRSTTRARWSTARVCWPC